jgi:hypothetical protein
MLVLLPGSRANPLAMDKMVLVASRPSLLAHPLGQFAFLADCALRQTAELNIRLQLPVTPPSLI